MRVRTLKCESGEATQNRGDYDLALESAERGTDAEMHALAERQMAKISSTNVEPVGLCERSGVTVG